MNIEALALFSMARGFSLQVSDISTRIGTVYSMRFLEQVGRGISKSIIAKQMKQYLLFQLLVVIPLLSWAAYIILPFIVNNFIPKYSESNEAFLILLITGFFYVLNSGLTNPWIMEKKLINRGLANLFGLAGMTVAIAVQWFIFHKQTINDIAYATAAGYFLYFVYMVIAVGKDFWRWRECAEIIISVTIGAIWLLLILSTSYTFITKNAGFIINLKTTLLSGGWTLIAILPVPLYGLKRSKILKGWSQ